VTVPARLSIATLAVRDLPTLRAFYERLGWVCRYTDDTFAAFNTGGAYFTLYDRDHLQSESGITLPEGANAGFSLAVNVDAIADVDAAIAAARDAGATITAEPRTMDWGGRSGYFTDPEGNLWEVAWMPDSTFDERGALVWPDRA
jgi:catechol 2,3-dioxygenase-like lactoylglutathione lyase family enzyme